MTVGDRYFLLHRLDETRLKIEELLPKIDPKKEIYPGWTIKDMLAHITGWDDATIDSLRAHVAGRAPAVPANRGIDEYNARTVTSRQNLDYEHILKEWRLTRQVLHTILEEMPDEKLFEPLIVPWGNKGTVTYLVDILRDHEEEHAHDINEWLKSPEKLLGKAGN
jgi:hypothetical protein